MMVTEQCHSKGCLLMFENVQKVVFNPVFMFLMKIYIETLALIQHKCFNLNQTILFHKVTYKKCA